MKKAHPEEGEFRPGAISRWGRNVHNGCLTLWQCGVCFVYPQTCPFCGDEAGSASSMSSCPSLCVRCCCQLAETIESACARCGAPVGPHLETSSGCIHCRGRRFAFERAVCLGVYKDALRRACLESKKPNGAPLSAAMAQLLWQRQARAIARQGIDVVTSVPDHWSRRLVRPHNPSETLARALARCLQVDFDPHILLKVRRTPAQAALPPGKRLTNLKRAFRVRPFARMHGVSLLLVDDILTTGTTANEVSRVLRRAGASRVVVAVVARGLGGR